MSTFLQILSIVASSLVILVIFNVLKFYVLYKIKINKWIVLAAAVILFIIPMGLWRNMPIYLSRYIIPGLFAVLLLWFMDLSGFLKRRNSSKSNSENKGYTMGNAKENKKDIVIRPKAKPNRIKNIKK